MNEIFRRNAIHNDGSGTFFRRIEDIFLEQPEKALNWPPSPFPLNCLGLRDTLVLELYQLSFVIIHIKCSKRNSALTLRRLGFLKVVFSVFWGGRNGVSLTPPHLTLLHISRRSYLMQFHWHDLKITEQELTLISLG